MADLGAYNEDVKFNWAAADKLVAELRSTATVLANQIGERKRISGITGGAQALGGHLRAAVRWATQYLHRRRAAFCR